MSLRIVDVFIWDECPIQGKRNLEAVDRLLRDLTQVSQDLLHEGIVKFLTLI